MSDLKPWLTALEQAPPGVSKLLSAYSGSASMPPDVHARLLVQAAKLSTLKPLGVAALLSSKPGVAAIAFAVAGAGAGTVTALSYPPAEPSAQTAIAARAPVARSADTTTPRTPKREPARPPPEATVSVEQLAPELPPKPRAAASTTTAASRSHAASFPATRSAASFPATHSRGTSSLLEEAALVDRARAALVADPELTLKLCAEHARRFPNGQLGSAREALNMRALHTLGRTREAREHAQKLLNQDPKTLHAEEASKLVRER